MRIKPSCAAICALVAALGVGVSQVRAAGPTLSIAAQLLQVAPTQAADVSALLQQLADGEKPMGVAQARAALINEIQTSVDNAAIAKTVVDGIEPARTSKHLISRLNAVIVLGRLTDLAAIDPLIKSLDDESEAVRLHAAKGLFAIVDRIRSNQSQNVPKVWLDAEGRILKAIQDRIKVEKAGVVIAEYIRAANVTEHPQAADVVLEVLLAHARLQKKRGDGQIESVDIVRSALRTRLQKLIQAAVAGKPAPPATLKQFALVSYLFMELSAPYVQAGSPTAYVNLFKDTDGALIWIISAIDSNSALKPFQPGGDPILHLAARKTKLQDDKIGFTADEIDGKQ